MNYKKYLVAVLSILLFFAVGCSDKEDSIGKEQLKEIMASNEEGKYEVYLLGKFDGNFRIPNNLWKPIANAHNLEDLFLMVKII